MLEPVKDWRNQVQYTWAQDITEWYEDQLGPWEIEGCPFTREERYEAAQVDYVPKRCNVCGDWLLVLRLNKTRKCINQWVIHPRPGHWNRQPKAIPMGCTTGIYEPVFPLPKIRRKIRHIVNDDGTYTVAAKRRPNAERNDD